jgi:hypothetical protein
LGPLSASWTVQRVSSGDLDSSDTRCVAIMHHGSSHLALGVFNPLCPSRQTRWLSPLFLLGLCLSLDWRLSLVQHLSLNYILNSVSYFILTWAVLSNYYYYYYYYFFIFFFLCLLTAIGLMPVRSVTKIGRTYKIWTYIARKQNIHLTKKQHVHLTKNSISHKVHSTSAMNRIQGTINRIQDTKHRNNKTRKQGKSYCREVNTGRQSCSSTLPYEISRPCV